MPLVGPNDESDRIQIFFLVVDIVVDLLKVLLYVFLGGSGRVSKARHIPDDQPVVICQLNTLVCPSDLRIKFKSGWLGLTCGMVAKKTLAYANVSK
jgi:hypothetical protein